MSGAPDATVGSARNRGWPSSSAYVPAASLRSNADQTSFFWSMTVAYSDSRPALYVVSPWWKTLCCLAHGELAWLFHEPRTELEDCLNMLLSCAKKMMSDADSDLAPSLDPFRCLWSSGYLNTPLPISFLQGADDYFIRDLYLAGGAFKVETEDGHRSF